MKKNEKPVNCEQMVLEWLPEGWLRRARRYLEVHVDRCYNISQQEKEGSHTCCCSSKAPHRC